MSCDYKGTYVNNQVLEGHVWKFQTLQGYIRI